jgi:hypothetical protein
VSRAATRQISFADWELMRQGIRLEPVLQAVSDFLDDQHRMIERVRRDLVRGLKKRSRRFDAAPGPALAGSHAGEELGLS